MPEVRTSDGHLVRWNRRKIVEQLLRETKLAEELFGVRPISKDEAERVALLVEERIRGLGLKFVSAPLIREMVNHALLELSERDPRFALYRNVCTRCGVPVYDAYEAFYGISWPEGGPTNPMLAYRRIAESTAREVALLLLPPRLADAHLKGEIHIHDLEHFVMEIMYAAYDPRYFVRFGLYPDGMGVLTNVAKPAKRLEVALRHIAMALASGATHVSSSQTVLMLNVVLAPYVRRASELRQAVQSFLFEVSQAYAVHGGSRDFAVIQLAPEPLGAWASQRAIFGGRLLKDTFADYAEEAFLLFKALINGALEGDGEGKPFLTPIMDIYVGPRIGEEAARCMIALFRRYGALHLDVLPEGSRAARCAHGCTFSSEAELSEHVSLGVKQVVAINVPRLAYRAKGDEDRLREQLWRAVELAAEIFRFKERWLRRLVEGKRLPFLLQEHDGKRLLELDRLCYVIDLVGLRDAVRYVAGCYPHEDDSALRLAVRLADCAQHVAERVEDLRIIVGESLNEAVCRRLAIADILIPTYRYEARRLVRGDLDETSRLLKRGVRDLPVSYTSSRHLVIDLGDRRHLEAELKLRSKLPGGSPLRLMAPELDFETIRDLVSAIVSAGFRGHVIIYRKHGPGLAAGAAA